MSSLRVNLETYRIPLEEIIRVTKHFSSETQIGDGGFGMVYRGQLSEHWENRSVAIKRLNPNGCQGNEEFYNELEMVKTFNHPNIIPFIGYCDDANEKIVVYEYATNKSLDRHLQNPDKRRCLTWTQRLKICLGAARGLKYLHSGVGEQRRVIHRDVKSANILLDDKMEAKVCDFGLSRFSPRDQPNTRVRTRASGTKFYIDPIYNERGRLTKESDIYSFGVVMFEMSTGMMAYDARRFEEANEQYLIGIVRSTYEEHDNISGLDKLIDPAIRGQGRMYVNSFRKFNDIAYKCIDLDISKRPTMDRIIEEIEEALNIQVNLETCRIPLEEIIRATKHFSSETQIGDGGFGMVYRGQLSEQWENRYVAIKRQHPNGYQGNEEFYNELEMLKTFKHPNIIPFIGYCDDANEKIVVYEYATNKSLDCHLQNPDKRRCLTWTQRLKICLGAARGLKYLHSGVGEYRTVIHRDMKSANILLDDNLEAKVCDFGLSRFTQIDQPDTHVCTRASGTKFYIDPVNKERSRLTKESDIYSFGVVMFEMSTGTMAYDARHFEEANEQYLIGIVRSTYVEHGNISGLDKLIDPAIRGRMYVNSFRKFHDIAYECIDLNIQRRPTMDRIIEGIMEALNIQIFNSNKTVEWQHDREKNIYMCGAKDLSIAWNHDTRYWKWGNRPESRFPEVCILGQVYWLEIQGRIAAVELSQKCTYVAYLVFQTIENSTGLDVPAKTRVRIGAIEIETKNVYLKKPQHVQEDYVLPHGRNDGWMEIKLGEFESNQGDDGEVEMAFMEVSAWKQGLIVEGFEIRPK